MALACSGHILAQEDPEELKEQADELFEQQQYEKALPKYSQLLSLSMENSEINYKYGACLLFTDEDKEAAMKYLKFAATKGNEPPPLAHYYYALGLHNNYRFDKAIDQYHKYKEKGSKRDSEFDFVDHNIEQCVSGKNLVSSFTDIRVLQKEVLPRSDFFRNYDLQEIGGKVIVKPEDFMSDEDKKRDGRFLMYFNQNSQFIYYASYSDKNATGKDIYVVERTSSGDWGESKRLSDVINTRFDEDFPFNHPDGKTLYFASKGHNSMGGYDIFKSTQTASGSWTQPVNMEFAINTPWDDFLFITDKDEQIAWFASNRETSSKEATVFKIALQRIPLDLTLIKGNFQTEGLSQKAKITIEDMVQNRNVGVFETDRQSGDYMLEIRGSGKYKFIVEAEESSSIHTGIVEIPRSKGLKQFKQEMKLVAADGGEKLKIINHFDEPLPEEESLMSAEILKNQASLEVNASEDDIKPTTTILDDGAVTKSGQDTPEDALGFAESQIEKTQNEVDSLNKIASRLYANAQEKQASDSEESISEAALSATLAMEYKKAANEKEVALDQLIDAKSELQAATDEEAKTAKFNQFQSIAGRQKSLKKIEGEIQTKIEKRSNNVDSSYSVAEANVKQLESDLEGIDEEIAYYQTEIDATKDKGLKEQLNQQIEDAQAAKPEKQAELRKAREALAAIEPQRATAGKLMSLTSELVTGAKASADAATNVEAGKISILSQSINQKAASIPGVMAVVDPSAAPKPAIAKSNETARSDQNEDDINETIENIASEDSSVDKVKGDYDDHFLDELAEVEAISDPLNAETKKAELYDQWADNIQLRADSIAREIQTTTDPALKSSLQEDRIKLESEAKDKRAMAMESYEAIALMNDQEAEMAVVNSNPDQETETVSEDPSTATPSTPEPEPVSQNTSSSESSEKNEFEQKLEEAQTIEDEVERKYALADINRQWASELQTELDKTALAIQNANDADEKRELEAKAEALATLRQEKQSEAAQLSREANEAKTTSQTAASAQQLEEDLVPLISNYNRASFENVESQISASSSSVSPGEFNKLNSVLLRSWILSLQNEEVKTEARLRNNSDPAAKQELTKKLDRLKAEKIEVKQRLVELNQSEGEAVATTEAEPKDEILQKANERFEGYQPVDQEYAPAAEAKRSEKIEKRDQLESEINALTTALSSAKKKEREAIESELQDKENELKVVQAEATFYAESGEKLEAVEGQLIQMNASDPLPSESEAKKVEELNETATAALERAQSKRSEAEGVRKKKDREIAMKEADELESAAAVALLEADLAAGLLEQIKSIEEQAITSNYLVLPGRQAVLPVVKKRLNPTEYADVSKTSEFQEYSGAMNEAAELKNQADALESQESQLRNEAQSEMTNSLQIEDSEARSQALAQASKKFDRADSLSAMSARMKRQSLYVQNEANQNLLERPEEVYLNVLAAMKSKPEGTGAIAANPVQTLPENQTESGLNEESETSTDLQTEAQTEAQLADNTQATNNTSTAAENSQPNNTTPANNSSSDDFNLTAPTQNNRPVNIPSNPLTETVFEIESPSATASTASDDIPIDPKLPEGLLYKIQVGAFRNPIPAGTFGNIKPLVGESAGNGLTRYTVGLFQNFTSAEEALSQVKSLGYGDAFIVSYYSGSRVPMNEAQAVENNQIEVPPSYNPNQSASRPAANNQNSGVRLLKQGPLQIQEVGNDPNLFYTVQVGVYSRPVTSEEIKNITPLNQETMPNGNFRYSSGRFNSLQKAEQARDEARSLGVVDAFVVAYRNGQRLTGGDIPATNGNNQNVAATPPQTQPTQTPSEPKFRIRLGNYVGDVPVAEASAILSLSSEGVKKEGEDDGSNSYFYGAFATRAEAEQKVNELKNNGLTQATVVPLP